MGEEGEGLRCYDVTVNACLLPIHSTIKMENRKVKIGLLQSENSDL